MIAGNEAQNMKTFASTLPLFNHHKKVRISIIINFEVDKN